MKSNLPERAINQSQSQFKKIFLAGWRPYLWIAFFGFAVYFRTLFFSFTYLDDNILILDNFFFIKDLGNIFKAFQFDVFYVSRAFAAFYRPLLTVSLMFDAAIGGQSPWIYHLTNILMHLSASVLVFKLFAKLNYRRSLAFVASLFFVIHPVLSQAASWIPGRNDSMLAIFILLAFIFLINYCNHQGKAGWKYLAWHCLFFALALFTKETAIFLVPLACLYYFTILKKENRKSIINSVITVMSWIAVLLVWYFIRHQALAVNTSPMTFLEMAKSLLMNSPATIHYLGKVFFPFNLSVLPLMQDTTFIYGIIAIVIGAVLFFLNREKNWPLIVFGLSWFVFFLIPSYIFPNQINAADFIEHEHRMYLPLVGLFIFLMEIFQARKMDSKKQAHVFLIGAVLIIFSLITFIHIGVFANRISFWENAAKTSPHAPLTHKNLGAMYYLDGNLTDAKIEYEKALALNAFEPMVHNNLGLVYANMNQPREAEQEYLKELSFNPTYPNAYFNLGLLYYSFGGVDEAIQLWNKTLELNPDYGGVYANMIIHYYQSKQFDKAKEYYDRMRSRNLQIPDQITQLFN